MNLCRLDSGLDEGLPGVEPVLYLRGSGNIKVLGQVSRGISHECIGATSEYCIAFLMKDFHLNAKFAVANYLLLASEVMSMDGGIVGLPQDKEVIPEHREGMEQPPRARVSHCFDLLTSDIASGPGGCAIELSCLH